MVAAFAGWGLGAAMAAVRLNPDRVYDVDMLVLNLSCSNGHLFEGWFGSNDDYESQQRRAMLSCPMCGTEQITRMPSAPRLNVSHLREGTAAREVSHRPDVDASAQPASQAQPSAKLPAGEGSPSAQPTEALWKQVVEHVLKNTEDVGNQFAEEARRIHYGESEQRGIRGSASPEDTAALRDEGIEVMSLPLPLTRKGPLQ